MKKKFYNLAACAQVHMFHIWNVSRGLKPFREHPIMHRPFYYLVCRSAAVVCVI